ncbi:MAG: DUF3524 domain-containing protein [Planctomycetota bacterium]|nr:DUF3524 domain-containing protein [Planctomycetota bacterium]
MDKLRVLALEPYAAASHASFLEGLAAASRHDFTIQTLPARLWKWRMRTSALGMVEHVVREKPDVLFASDFLNLAELRALLPPELRSIPAVTYFHENQLTYPVRQGERPDVHHGLTNIHSILCSDRTLFNSAYHRDGFLAAAKELLERVPDLDLSNWHVQLEEGSSVLGLGTDVPASAMRPLQHDEAPILVWNHRWEYDKNPDAFLALLTELERRATPFRLSLLGMRFRGVPDALLEIESRFADRIVTSGFAATKDDYVNELRRGHILVSTSSHEFFGLSSLEGMRCGLLPVLPNDLAYPELLPAELRRAPFLYDREEGEAGVAAPADAVQLAIEVLRGEALEATSRALAAFTRQFEWRFHGSKFDAVLEAVALRTPN